MSYAGASNLRLGSKLHDICRKIRTVLVVYPSQGAGPTLRTGRFPRSKRRTSDVVHRRQVPVLRLMSGSGQPSGIGSILTSMDTFPTRKRSATAGSLLPVTTRMS